LDAKRDNDSLAVKVAGSLISTIKQARPQKAHLFDDLSGIATKPFGPDPEDWWLPPGSTQNPDGSITLPDGLNFTPPEGTIQNADGTFTLPDGTVVTLAELAAMFESSKLDPAMLLLLGGGVLLASDIL